MKRKLLAIILAAAMALSFTACIDSGSDDSSLGVSEKIEVVKERADSLKEEAKDRVDSIKDRADSIKEDVKDVVDSVKEDIKNDFDSSPLGKIKQGVDDVKEIVSDAKEIKDALQGDKVTAPLKAKKCKGENYEEIKEKFEDAGFTDIKTKGNGKLKVGLLHDEGDVESVSINGDDSFDKGDKFSEDAKVVITYFSK